MATTAIREASAVTGGPAPSQATLEFVVGREIQNGDITQNGMLALMYDPARLPYIRNTHNGMPAWDITGTVRFHPGLETHSRSVVQKTETVNGVLKGVYPPVPLPFSVPVPPDAMAVEMWFLNTGLYGEKSWDSRYGQNYWFGVAQLGPAQPVSFRAGAIRDMSMVNVLSLDVNKILRTIGGSPQGSELETDLNLTAWVRNVQYQKNVWIDFHVFDGNDNLVHAETFPLTYREPGGGGGDIFAFERRIFKGSGGLPGSVWPRPDARSLQLRLYYDVGGQVFSDGLLHQSALPPDTEVGITLATAA
jgi:Family of unknown function (DUF6209)